MFRIDEGFGAPARQEAPPKPKGSPVMMLMVTIGFFSLMTVGMGYLAMALKLN